MKKYICRIEVDRCICSGFFCKIPFPTKEKRLPVLITSGMTVDAYRMKNEKETISMHIEGEKDNKIINLNNRLIYTKINEHLNIYITIIEIKSDDNINNYLELDDNIINDIINDKDKTQEYINTQVYLIGYLEGKLSVSFGFIDNILEETFDHNCISEYSVGSAVLNINTKKIIGMDSSIYISRKKHYMGYFINYFIKEFIQLNYYKKQYKEAFIDKNKRVVKFDKYIPMDKFNLITKFLGNEVHEKLNYLFHDYGMKYYSSLDYYRFDDIQIIIE